ncbi:type II RES/Xre toxin-antitoxin system antitoxin [Pedobacter montanisoli]|uniref:MbcA/ParS/Xre antitoxin family protein n=1 Tax=Pedobacter montanisoli TaxID=2923277 RepID=A0ABS9ZW00_9SPHI|nr:MbcA/ParS/Xre antitoxin family protein [Pedobacter montanisoli]MCJ0742484.1 MbcA/ParS/Xre antitoxin family protein [Pedobacter montanisoli]
MKKKSEENNSQVNEPLMAYETVQSPLSVVFGGQFANPTDFELLNLARKGISKKTLLALAKKLSLTIEDLATVLHISERTLQRYTPSTLIKTEYADKAIELARLYERGAEVLGSSTAFTDWVKTPNYAINGEIPFNLLDTSIGFDIILDLLGRIEHGVFS